MGAHGAGASDRELPLRSCAPERSQSPRERNSARNTGQTTERSRASEEHGEKEIEQTRPGPWASDAHALIAALPDAALRSVLDDYYEETAAFIEYEQERSRAEAEQDAFGLLLFQILRRGIDARSASWNAPATEPGTADAIDRKEGQ